MALDFLLLQRYPNDKASRLRHYGWRAPFVIFALIGRVPVLTIVLAVLPGLAIMGIFWSIARLMVEEQDEFIRMLIVRQSLIATGLALSVASVWGFLEAYGVAPHIDSYWVAVLWFFGLGVGAVANKVQYGAVGECW